MGLPLLVAEDLRLRLEGLREAAGPFLLRDLMVRSQRIRLGGSSATLPGGGFGVGGGGPVAPRGSYQWLLFETIDGGVPAGAADFEFEGEPIPFVGAITEVDVVASDPNDFWQMGVFVDGQGSVFRSSQSAVALDESGFFRPTPPGFWPETEGLVFPLPSPGQRPRIKVRRKSDKAKNLTIRVLIVAHPA